MVDVGEIKAGILEKSIERTAAVERFRADVKKKIKEIEEGKKRYRTKFSPKMKKQK